jgi:hypothetical protein
LLALVAWAAGLLGQAEPAPTEIYQDFRGNKPLSPFLTLVGPDADSVIKREEGGLRITLPPNRKQPPWEGVGVRSTQPLSGDFEVTGTFELLSERMPTALDMGVALNVGARLYDNNQFARVGRFLHPTAGHVYTGEYWIRGSLPPPKAVTVQATGRIGQLRIVRRGSTLSLQIADGLGEDFREICSGEFSAEELEVVQFWVNNRGNAEGIDARLLDFRIRTHFADAPPAAEPRNGMSGGDATTHDPLPATEPVKRLNWAFLLLASGLVLAGALAAVLLWVKRFPRHYWLPAFALPALLGAGIALQFGWAHRESDTKVAGTLYQDFRGSRFPQPPLYLDGPDATAVTTAEEGGLRITLPANRQAPPWAPAGLVPSFRLSGNFEVTGTYKLLSTNRPTRGRGAGVVLWLATGWVQNTKFAEIARFLRPEPGEDNVHGADYWVNVSGGPNSGSRELAATEPTGRLRLIREGSQVRFLAADGADQDFHELLQADFGADDLVMRFAVNNNTSPTSVDARLVDLTIRAAAFKPIDSPAQTEEGQDVPAQGLTWKAWLALGLALCLTLALCLAVRHSRRTGNPAAPIKPDASSPISFSCPACGKNLKANPALAGKRVKCPSCARGMTVPGTREEDPACS